MAAAAALFAASCGPSVDVTPVDPEPGVALTLAAERVRIVSDVRYALTFDIPAAADQPIEASAVIRFKVSEPGHPIVFDFVKGAEPLKQPTVGGRT